MCNGNVQLEAWQVGGGCVASNLGGGQRGALARQEKQRQAGVGKLGLTSPPL